MFRYEQTEIGDLDAIIRLYEEYLNYGNGVKENLTMIMNAADTFGYKCVFNNEIIGMFILENTLSFTGGRHDFADEILRDSGGKPVWTGTALVVKEEFRRQGIADELIKRGLEGLKKRGVHHLALDMWVYPDGSIPSLKFLEFAKSYICYGLIENFYEDMHNIEIYCPICGANCTCSTKLYVIEI